MAAAAETRRDRLEALRAQMKPGGSRMSTAHQALLAMAGGATESAYGSPNQGSPSGNAPPQQNGWQQPPPAGGASSLQVQLLQRLAVHEQQLMQGWHPAGAGGPHAPAGAHAVAPARPYQPKRLYQRLEREAMTAAELEDDERRRLLAERRRVQYQPIDGAELRERERAVELHRQAEAEQRRLMLLQAPLQAPPPQPVQLPGHSRFAPQAAEELRLARLQVRPTPARRGVLAP